LSTTVLDAINLPESIKRAVQMYPVEDLTLAIMRAGLPDLPSFSLIPQSTAPYDFFAVFRRVNSGAWAADPRFVDSAGLQVAVFTKDPDGDSKAALISEAIRVTLIKAASDQQVYPGLGHLVSARVTNEPAKGSDWAPSSGPVQYADLPSGFTRYQTTYSLKIRRPL